MVSYLEIYNETLRHLLNRDTNNVQIHEDSNGVVEVASAKAIVASTLEVVLQVKKEGEANRKTGATYMNEKSSRSHSIFQIIIESRDHVEEEVEGGCVNVSQLNLVDLAGSERAGQTGATRKHFKEVTIINKSLSSFALIRKQLSEDPNKFVNYGDSKLMRLLQNSGRQLQDQHYMHIQPDRWSGDSIYFRELIAKTVSLCSEAAFVAWREWWSGSAPRSRRSCAMEIHEHLETYFDRRDHALESLELSRGSSDETGRCLYKLVFQLLLLLETFNKMVVAFYHAALDNSFSRARTRLATGLLQVTNLKGPVEVVE